VNEKSYILRFVRVHIHVMHVAAPESAWN